MRLLDYRENADYCSIWEKAGNRKIVLWNTHFSLTGGDGWGTYSLFKDIIFDYFDTHLDMFLLWRPHPLFYGALAQASDKSLEEVNAWFRLLHTKENYYIDKSAGFPMSLLGKCFVPERELLAAKVRNIFRSRFVRSRQTC